MPEAQPSETPFICRRLPVVPGAPFGDHGSHGHTVDPTTATVAKRSPKLEASDERSASNE